MPTPLNRAEPLNRPDLSWNSQLASSIRTTAELLTQLQLSAEQFPNQVHSPLHEPEFPLFVPESFLRRIEIGNPTDPLLLQVLPQQAELSSPDSFVADPLQEAAVRSVPGLLHKYEGRVLLITARSCAINCRYCFRREYPYQQEPSRLEDWEPALNYVRENDSVREVILSGGDPLMLTDIRLRQLHDLIAEIPHVNRLRIHTRLPIVLPARVNAELLDLLTTSRLQAIVVVHANHPHEIADDCKTALQKLAQAGVTMLNQSVLLKNVNDNTKTLAELCERLVDIGVLPYYLHQLDHVSGTSHFEVPHARGRQIIAELRERLPGYAVPRYVQELPGEQSKTVIEFE